MKLNLAMMRLIAAMRKKKKKVLRKAQRKNLMKKIPMKVGNDCQTTVIHGCTWERNDLSVHYDVRLCVSTVAAIRACFHLQNFPISKMSSDFKNYKTKMCVRPFWATLIFGHPPAKKERTPELAWYIISPPSSHFSSRSSSPYCFISLSQFNSLHLNQFITSFTNINQSYG